MLNISIAGIGGQGSVLTAKLLAEAASAKGWQVRTAETTGMAQRGGDVMSHVRLGNNGEEVFAPLPAKGQVDVVIALEPGEGLRALPLLKPDGLMVVATSGMAPTVLDFKAPGYNAASMVEALKESGRTIAVVNDVALCMAVGSRKALNVIMLAVALQVANEFEAARGNALAGQISLEEMRGAVAACVKPRFQEMNNAAISYVESHAQEYVEVR